MPWSLVAILGAVVSGALIGERLGAGPGRGSAVLALVATLAVALARRRARTVLVGVVFAAFGAASMQRALDGLVHSPVAPFVAARSEVVARGALTSDPEGTRFTSRVILRLGGFQSSTGAHVDGGGRRVLVVAGASAGPRLRLLSAGDRVQLRGWLDPLSGFDERLRWQHVVARLHASEISGLAGPRSPLTRLANRARDLVLAGGTRLSPSNRALLAGFLLGDTRQLPDEMVERFRAAGMTHLLAVSGGNVAFVLALFSPLIRRCSLRGRLVLGLAVLGLFGTMTRWEPSVLRAVTMAGIGMSASYLGRPAAGPRAVLLACVALVLADPFLVHSVGFMLSAGASFAITVLAAPIGERLRGPAWLRETLAVTLAAQIGVAPILLAVFGAVPLGSIPANVVAVPLAGPLTAWGFVSGVIGGVVAPVAGPVSAALQLPTAAMLHALVSIADLAARVPFTLDGRALVGLVAASAVVGAARHTRRLRADASPLPPR